MAINRLLLDQATGCGFGNYTSMTMSVELAFEKNPDHKASDENSPSHFVYIKGKHGLVDAGAAWTKQVTQGNNRGSKFLSFTVDDPDFAQPLNLYAFAEAKPASKDVPQEYAIRWRRRQEAA